MTKEAMKLALVALEVDPFEMVEDTDGHMVFLTNQAITALREALAEQPAQQEPVAWMWVVDGKPKTVSFGGANSNTPKEWAVLPLYTTPPAQRTWIDPNDKTQTQYLPHIGEPVLFCHKGMTHMGKHTGGSFQSEVTNQYFKTWECHWMYLPAAHGIKENI